MPCLESVLPQPGQTPVCRAEHNHTVTGNSTRLGNRSSCLTSRLPPGLGTGDNGQLPAAIPQQCPQHWLDYPRAGFMAVSSA